MLRLLALVDNGHRLADAKVALKQHPVLLFSLPLSLLYFTRTTYICAHMPTRMLVCLSVCMRACVCACPLSVLMQIGTSPLQETSTWERYTHLPSNELVIEDSTPST